MNIVEIKSIVKVLNKQKDDESKYSPAIEKVTSEFGFKYYTFLNTPKNPNC